MAAGDEGFDHGAGVAGRVVAAVDLAVDQGAFKEHQVLVDEPGREVEALFGGELGDPVDEELLVLRGGLVDRVVGVGELQCSADEHAPAVLRAVEPVVEDVEHRDQFFERLAAGDRLDLLHPGVGLPAMTQGDRFEHELVPALEVFVEGGLGDARLGEDAVEAHGVEAVVVEQVDRGDQQPIPAGGGDVHDAQQLDDGLGSLGLGHVHSVTRGCTTSHPRVDLECTLGRVGASYIWVVVRQRPRSMTQTPSNLRNTP